MNTGPIFNRLHCISFQLTIICNELTTLKLCNAFSADGYDVNFIYKVKIVYCLWYIRLQNNLNVIWNKGTWKKKPIGSSDYLKADAHKIPFSRS